MKCDGTFLWHSKKKSKSQPPNKNETVVAERVALVANREVIKEMSGKAL